MADIVQGAGRVHGRRYICGVPDARCSGSYVATHGKGMKVHETSKEAFRCMCRYLLAEGYTQIGPREFAAPDNGPIRVLSKQSKYGAPLRPGKGNRWMFPLDRTGGVVASV